MRKLILFLLRKKLGVKKHQMFVFANQKTWDTRYYFTDDAIMKNDGKLAQTSNVRINYLLSDACEVIPLLDTVKTNGGK